MNAVADEETQRRGFVAVPYALGMQHTPSTSGSPFGFGMQEKVLPIKFAAVHYCFEVVTLKPVMALAKLALSTSSRLRSRTHQGM
jgi:hypothetical protein